MSWRNAAGWAALARTHLSVGRDGKVDFWRVEDREGNGPYNGGRSGSWMKAAGESRGSGRNPQPQFQVERTDVFGFTDLQQYRKWFTPDQRQRLGAAGFQLVRYRVPAGEVRPRADGRVERVGDGAEPRAGRVARGRAVRAEGRVTTRSGTGWARMLAGDWSREAFKDWLSSVSPRPSVRGAPEWRGESGARVVVLHECGHGDALMLVRYAKTMAARGCAVYWQGTPALEGLLGTAPGVALELSSIEHATRVKVDAWVRALDLPALLGATPAEPGGARAPYLRPRWRRALPWSPRRVGLCWHGGLEHGYGPLRDLPPALAEELALRVRGRFVSLVPGETLAGFEAGVPAGARFLETARLIRGLDAVVTTDTAVAHLAGAMGAPTILLLNRQAADWRWAGAWYPTVEKVWAMDGDWRSAVDLAVDALRR